jgi:hypothetical protein
MPAYDDRFFDPAAPVAFVTLRNPLTGSSETNVRMLMDSGADVTLLPVTAIERLGISAEANSVVEIVGFDGHLSVASVAKLEMLFLAKTFRGRFLLIDQSWGVLGRDVLNLVSLILDGPRLTWHENRRK